MAEAGVPTTNGHRLTPPAEPLQIVVEKGPLAGLPGDARFITVVGKSPAQPAWNTDPACWLTAEQALKKRALEDRWTGISLMTGASMGRLVWLDFDGEAVDESTGEILKSASRDFDCFFMRSPDELPPCPKNTSGRPGRWRGLFRMPADWADTFHGFSITSADSPTNAFELLYEKAGRKPFHAVVEGSHPDGQGWFYRWLPGCSPAEIDIPDLPVWMIAGLIRFMAEKARPKSNEDGTFKVVAEGQRPFEALTSLQRDKLLLKHMLPYAPQRKGAGSGSYPLVRRLICGMIHEFGPRRAQQLLEDSGWEAGNDWESGKSLSWMIASLARSDVEEDRQANIASVIWLCTEEGNGKGKAQWPESLLPPRDPLDRANELQKLLVQMNESESEPVTMALLMGHAKRMGVAESTIYRLRLDALLGAAEQQDSRTLDAVEAVARKDNKTTDVVDGLLRRRVVCLAGASNSGKTTLAAMLASRVVTGTPLNIGGVLHHVDPGRVLWMGSDTSDLNVAEELALQGVDSTKAGDAVRVVAGASFNNLLRIVQEIQTHQPDLIVMDCLSSMAINGVSVADPAFSEPMRILQRHNGVAWPRCAFLLLHHTTRDTPKRFSGGEQIKAGVEGLWIYYDPALVTKKKSDEDKPAQESPLRRLWIEKDRSGFRGKEIDVCYEAADGRWQLRPHSDIGTDPRSRLDHFFRNYDGDEWLTLTEWQVILTSERIKIERKTLERNMKLLVGSLLECEMRFHTSTGHERRHYRALEPIRKLARASYGGLRDCSGTNHIDPDD